MNQFEMALKDDNFLELITDLYFEKFDKNKNQILEYNEFVNMVKGISKECKAPEPSEDEIIGIYKGLDKDKKKGLTKDECKVFIVEVLKKLAAKKK